MPGFLARSSLSITLLFAAAACDVASLSTGTGERGDEPEAPAAASSADSGAATGIDCIVEPETGATLCTGLSLCPGLLVDHDVFPRCGFRPGGTLIDLECACQGYLCPLGVAQTCAQAKNLLARQTEATVCVQIAEGRCTMAEPSAQGQGQPKPSTCDRQCASECANAPGCLLLCGC